jgi:hypothetical protein
LDSTTSRQTRHSASLACYHLPAFYELYAQYAAEPGAERWRALAEVSRQFAGQKYHAFVADHIQPGNVSSALFALDGGGAEGGSSTALTATLASAARHANAPSGVELEVSMSAAESAAHGAVGGS